MNMYELGQLSQTVIDWNKVFQDENMDLTLKIENQVRVCEEEDKEYQEAIQNNDHLEVLDALCDRVYTHTYLLELMKQSSENYSFTFLENLVADINHFSLITNDTFIKAFQEVTRSNYSKFIFTKNRVCEQEEIQWITEKRKHQGKIKAVRCDGWLFFRDMNGLGKLMKPSTFIEPDLKQFLKDI